MNTNVVIAIGVVAIVIIAMVFGARLGYVNLEFLGLKASAKAAERKGARVEKIEVKGDRNQGHAIGEGSVVSDIKVEGNDSSFSARTDGT